MARRIKTISFDEFSTNVRAIFDKVLKGRRVIIEDGNGEVVILKPKHKHNISTEKNDADYKAFVSASGSWDDVDVDSFNEAVRESRVKSSRHRLNFEIPS